MLLLQFETYLYNFQLETLKFVEVKKSLLKYGCTITFLNNDLSLLLSKGSPQSVERARFLVTEALNSPSIFQNQTRNNITLGGFIEQKTLPSASPATTPSPSTQNQPTPFSHEADPPVSKQSLPMPNNPRTSAPNSNANSLNGNFAKPAAPIHTTPQSFAPQPAQNQMHTNRVSYSKVTSGAWHSSQKTKVLKVL